MMVLSVLDLLLSLGDRIIQTGYQSYTNTSKGVRHYSWVFGGKHRILLSKKYTPLNSDSDTGSTIIPKTITQVNTSNIHESDGNSDDESNENEELHLKEPTEAILEQIIPKVQPAPLMLEKNDLSNQLPNTLEINTLSQTPNKIKKEVSFEITGQNNEVKVEPIYKKVTKYELTFSPEYMVEMTNRNLKNKKNEPNQMKSRKEVPLVTLYDKDLIKSEERLTIRNSKFDSKTEFSFNLLKGIPDSSRQENTRDIAPKLNNKHDIYKKGKSSTLIHKTSAMRPADINSFHSVDRINSNKIISGLMKQLREKSAQISPQKQTTSHIQNKNRNILSWFANSYSKEEISKKLEQQKKTFDEIKMTFKEKVEDCKNCNKHMCPGRRNPILSKSVDTIASNSKAVLTRSYLLSCDSANTLNSKEQQRKVNFLEKPQLSNHSSQKDISYKAESSKQLSDVQVSTSSKIRFFTKHAYETLDPHVSYSKHIADQDNTKISNLIPTRKLSNN